MSIYALQFMVGRAVVSDEYRTGILNGRKAELIRDLDLDPGESAQVMAIHASTLAEFAAAVDQIVQSQQSPASHSAGAWSARQHY